MKDPIVIDPPNFDQQAAWGECREWVDQHEPGSMAGAAGADPGVCSCPACDQMYWAWGRVQKCAKCGFEYPTDAWAMFSWGTQAKWRVARGDTLAKCDKRRLTHQYFCYGYEHGPSRDECTATDGYCDLYSYYKAQDWRTIMATYDGHTKYSQPAPDPVDAEIAALFERTMKARKAIVEHLGGPWKRGMEGIADSIKCPICETGTLRFSRSGYNGHIHAGCSTEKCVRWME